MSLRFEIGSEGKTKKSPNLDACEIGIYLNRYGLVSTKEDKMGAAAFPEKSLLHQINHYSYCRRYLRNGYVYIYNETKDWIDEYEVIDGKYYEVLKYRKAASIQEETLSDSRSSDRNTLNKFYITEKQESVLWIIYSHVQWSTNYMIKYIKDENSFRTIRGQKYDTKKFIAKDAGYIGTTHIYFKPLSKQEIDEFGNTESQLRKEHRFSEILAEQSYREVESAIPKMQKEHKQFMVTFSLHDPIGCADDVTDDYARQIEYHTALTQGLPYAKTPEEMLANKGNASFINLKDKDIEQYVALNRASSIINDLIIRDNANNHNYQTYFDRESVKKVLGINERQESLSKMQDMHATLYTILTSNYYQNALIDIYNSPSSELVSGQKTVLKHHQIFAIYPGYLEYDRLLDYRKEDWNSYLYKSYYYGSDKAKEPVITKGAELQYVVRELLNYDPRKTTLFQDIAAKLPKAESTAKDFFINLDTSLGLYLFFMRDIDKVQIQKNINNLYNQAEDVIKLKNQTIAEITKQAKKDRVRITNKPYTISERFRMFFGSKAPLKKKANQRIDVSDASKIKIAGEEIKATKSLQVIEQQKNSAMIKSFDLDAKIDKLKWIDSKMFRGFLSTLSIVNLTLVITNESKLNLKTGMNTIGNMTETSSVLMSIAISEERNKQILDWIAKQAKSTKTIRYEFTVATRVGLIATAILSVVSIWDGIELIGQKQKLAGGLTLASGLTGLAASVIIWQSYALGLAVLGPIGVSLLFVSFFLALIGYFFVKEEMPRFLQASVYGRGIGCGSKIILTGSETPSLAIQKLYNAGNPKAKEFTTDDGKDYNLANFREMLSYLFNLVSGYQSSFNIYSRRTSGNFQTIDSFEIACKFNAALSFTQVEYAMRISYADEAYLTERNLIYLEPAYAPIAVAENGHICVRFKFELNRQLTPKMIETLDDQLNKTTDNPYYNTDSGGANIKIENLRMPHSNAPSPDVYQGDQRLKRFCFMLRIVDKDSGMDIPFSAESDDPLYNVVQGNLYSPDNDAYNFTNPEIEYTQVTKKQLYLS